MSREPSRRRYRQRLIERNAARLTFVKRFALPGLMLFGLAGTISVIVFAGIHEPMLNKHDAWFLLVTGVFFFGMAKRFGRELAGGLREPEDTPERIAAYTRWNVFIWRMIGSGLLVYGAWVGFGSGTR